MMSRQTMSCALPESMRGYIDNRVSAGNYGDTSEYIRDLVRRDQEEQAKTRLRDLIEEGLASGPVGVAPRRMKRNCSPSLAARSIDAGLSAPLGAARPATRSAPLPQGRRRPCGGEGDQCHQRRAEPDLT